MPDLNEEVIYSVDDAEAMSIPIDDTLSKHGQAAEAYAVGVALDGKMDALQISVNGEPADNQGAILITGTNIPVSELDSRKIDAALTALDNKTGADIPVSNATGATNIAAAIEAAKTTIDTQLSHTGQAADAKATGDAISDLADSLSDYVKSVDNITPDQTGNVALTGYAKSIEGITPGATGDVSLATLIATSTEVQAMIADVLAGTTGGTARTDAYISALMLRTALSLYHAGLPDVFPQRKVISVTIPAGSASYTVDDSWITADTDCYANTLEAQGVQTDVSWTFTAGHVAFTLGAAQLSALTFSFGMVKGGVSV